MITLIHNSYKCKCCLIWVRPKSKTKKYECVLKGSFNTVHPPIIQVVHIMQHILLKPGELKFKLVTHKNYNKMS